MSWLAQIAFWWLAGIGAFAVLVLLNMRRPKKRYPQPPINTRTADALADFAAWDAEFRTPSNTPE
jgi:hypothetical protein